MEGLFLTCFWAHSWDCLNSHATSKSFKLADQVKPLWTDSWHCRNWHLLFSLDPQPWRCLSGWHLTKKYEDRGMSRHAWLHPSSRVMSWNYFYDWPVRGGVGWWCLHVRPPQAHQHPSHPIPWPQPQRCLLAQHQAWWRPGASWGRMSRPPWKPLQRWEPWSWLDWRWCPQWPAHWGFVQRGALSAVQMFKFPAFIVYSVLSHDVDSSLLTSSCLIKAVIHKTRDLSNSCSLTQIFTQNKCYFKLLL